MPVYLERKCASDWWRGIDRSLENGKGIHFGKRDTGVKCEEDERRRDIPKDVVTGQRTENPSQEVPASMQ